MGELFLVPTPIGNLNEVSPRVREILSFVDFVACEDTRNTSKLLGLLGINKRCISCHEHNEKKESLRIIDELKAGKNVAYASDAGYPCISDPGFILVQEAIKNEIKVTPLSGPNAFLNALVGSGLDTKHFMFYGFLDSRNSQRESELEQIKDYPYTILFYEAPHRINETLKSLFKVLGNRKITVARELTKKFEEFIRSDLETLVEDNREYIGELVLVVEGNQSSNSSDDIEAFIPEVEKLINIGLSSKDAVAAVSELRNISKNKLYKAYIKR